MARGRVLIVNPFASGVTERKARGRPGGAAGRHGDGPHAGARRRDRARGGVVAAGRGDLRLLGRRDLQRGDQRPPRRHPGRVRARRRHERAAARARPPARSRSAPPSGSLSASRGASRSAASTAACSRSTPASGSTPSSSAGSTRSAAGADGKRPGDLAFALDGRAGARRAPLPLRAGARGRGARPGRVRARSPTARRTPTPGALGLRFAPDASFEGGLDIVAPIDVRAASDPAAGRPGAARAAAAPATCSSATTSTGS